MARLRGRGVLPIEESVWPVIGIRADADPLSFGVMTSPLVREVVWAVAAVATMEPSMPTEKLASVGTPVHIASLWFGHVFNAPRLYADDQPCRRNLA